MLIKVIHNQSFSKFRNESNIRDWPWSYNVHHVEGGLSDPWSKYGIYVAGHMCRRKKTRVQKFIAVKVGPRRSRDFFTNHVRYRIHVALLARRTLNSLGHLGKSNALKSIQWWNWPWSDCRRWNWRSWRTVCLNFPLNYAAKSSAECGPVEASAGSNKTFIFRHKVLASGQLLIAVDQ